MCPHKHTITISKWWRTYYTTIRLKELIKTMSNCYKMMKSVTNKAVLALATGFIINGLLLSPIAHANHSLNEPITLSSATTWKDIRDSQVTKQDKDYSCGASSLSTILTYFYQTPITETQILEDIAQGKEQDEIMASFQDLANVSKQYGFVGKGIATNYDSLKKIKIPVIVYLDHKRSDHFSVVRAIDEHNVYLSDSSWGNRTLTRKQFEKMWNTRNNETLQGRVLLILPTLEQQKLLTNQDFVNIKDTQQLLKQTPELFRQFM